MGVIHIHSQHLAKTLQRLGDLDESAWLNEAFALVISSGALWERDFVRPHSASYNPRPARVALILIHDALEKRPEVLAAGMLCSLGSELFSIEGGLYP